jgi:O-antigen ligase/tetratricopeptide (TPR) repeat protein
MMEKSKHKSSQSRTAKFERFGPDRLRPWLLAGAAALYVARPLLPSESAAASGDGLPLVMLWFWLALAWLLWSAARGQLALRLHWTDGALLLLAGWYAAACVVGAENNAGRPCINMLWEGLALLLGYFLVRQWLTTAHEARAMLAVMIALAVVESGYGLFEYSVTMPYAREHYKEDPDAALKEIGHWIPANSPERMLYEQRLNSTEPKATFVLANSLAGFLAPWFVVVLGIGFTAFAVPKIAGLANASPLKAAPPPKEREPSSGLLPQYVLLTLLCAVPIVACLILTKSRSAWLATGCGMALLGLLNWRLLARRWMKGLLAGVAVLFGVVIAIFTAKGALDLQVITEAGKSLGYRWQYWQATFSMIQDHFWLGCGPGNFQDYYTRYKLPTASEVVADPHNALFEIWATAGTPAMLALVVLLAGIAWKVWTSRLNSSSTTDTTTATQPAGPQSGGGLLIFLVAAETGLLLAFVTGITAEVPLTTAALASGIFMFAAAILLTSPWVHAGHLPRLLPAIAAIVLLVNLLAAGGISFPGVAGSLWLLLAVSMAQASLDTPPRFLTRLPILACIAAVGALTAACYFTGYEPVMTCRQALMVAARYQSSPGNYEANLIRAANADPWATEPRKRLASLEYELWEKRYTGDALTDFERAAQRIVEQQPQSSAAWRQKGDWYWNIVLRIRDVSEARKKTQEYTKVALEAYQRAAELYPNHALTRAKLAQAWQESGKHAKASQEAAEALRLDAITPHTDQKLPETLRELMQKIAANKPPS